MPSLSESFIGITKSALKRCDIEVRRISSKPVNPPLFDDPIEVMRKINSHEFASLNCPLAKCVSFNGMSFSAEGWHPFVQTAKEYIETGVRKFEGSHLERYYKNWQPADGRDALIGATLGPIVLEEQPSYIKHTPWSHRDVEERASYMSHIIEIENSSIGGVVLSPSDGYGLHGPVSKTKGEIEYSRIVDLVDTIRKHGFDRSKGNLTVEVLKRDEQFRYVLVHGQHRAAVMSALGYDYIPVMPIMIIENDYIEHWTSVYKKIWTSEEAITYFNHLFDFNSLAWAKERGLR